MEEGVYHSVDIAAVVPKGFRYYVMLFMLILSGFKRAYYYIMNFHKNDMAVLIGYGTDRYNGYMYIQKKEIDPDNQHYIVVDQFIIDLAGHVYNKDIIPANACRVYRIKNLKEFFRLIRHNETFDKLDACCENKHNEYILDTL